MHLSTYLRLLAELIEAVHEEAASLLVECALRERHNQQTPDRLQYFAYVPLLRIPVSLERVYADFARRLCHVRVEDLRQEVSLRWRLRKLVVDRQFTAEDTTGIGGSNQELDQSVLTQLVR